MRGKQQSIFIIHKKLIKTSIDHMDNFDKNKLT